MILLKLSLGHNVESKVPHLKPENKNFIGNIRDMTKFEKQLEYIQHFSISYSSKELNPTKHQKYWHIQTRFIIYMKMIITLADLWQTG